MAGGGGWVSVCEEVFAGGAVWAGSECAAKMVTSISSKTRRRSMDSGTPEQCSKCARLLAGAQSNPSGVADCTAQALIPMGARQTKGRSTSDSPSSLRLRLYEFEKICIYLVGVRGRHAVRQSWVGFQRTVLQELDRPCSGSWEGANLVVFTMHHQDRNID